MNEWGFTINTPYMEEIYSDFGYETEEEAYDAMNTYTNTHNISQKTYLCVVEQRWNDI